MSNAKDLFTKGKNLFGLEMLQPFQNLTPVNECLPYKSLPEVFNFLDQYNKKELPDWLSMTAKMTPGTSFCYPQWQMLLGERRAMLRRTTPKTLVCHDYKGGYQKDRFVNYNWEGEGSYNFTQWSLIDTFVYFSHYLVTVPPPCWINAGHAHGVLVLGTVITEGDAGRVIWDLILETEEKLAWFAEVLALISQVHQFDGYLLNIENSLSKEQVPKMLDFVRLLKKSLPKSSQVIWYDSVTLSGRLRWQNSLNLHNYDFFSICDGIFLNYSYQDWQLKKSGELAGGRMRDVYVGIDVFGRGCPGSGFLCSDAAVMARKYDLSIAVFAPGWTEETAPGDAIRNNNIFWSALSRYLYVHGTSDSRNLVKYLLGGKKISKENWNDLTGNVSQDYFLWQGEKGAVYLTLIPPTTDETAEQRAIINLQDAVVSYGETDVRKYYSEFPIPIMTVNEADNVTLTVDSRNQRRDVKIPLMIFEVDIKNTIEITMEARGSGVILGYATVDSGEEVVDLTFEVPVSEDYVTSGKITKSLTGKLLEVGVKVEPKSTAFLYQVKIIQS